MKDIAFFARSDLVHCGRHPEDGEAIIRESYYVVAESKDGRRWRHERSFEREDREKAEALAVRIESHVDGGGKLEEDRWFEADPCYGSSAYQDLEATGFFVAREKKEDLAQWIE